MTKKELLYNRFMMLYGSVVKAAVFWGVFAVFVIIILFLLKNTKRARRKKLKDNYMKVNVEMVDLIYNQVPRSFQLKMVYAHPKDGKKRYYFTEKIYYDPVMCDDVKLDYVYDMYVHPDDPMSYYVDVSKYVKNYPPFESWIRRI